ncbi:hypothetical protein FI667_g8575, partial [Globisporangium splendens]
MLPFGVRDDIVRQLRTTRIKLSSSDFIATVVPHAKSAVVVVVLAPFVYTRWNGPCDGVAGTSVLSTTLVSLPAIAEHIMEAQDVHGEEISAQARLLYVMSAMLRKRRRWRHNVAHIERVP